jgi:acyl-CoA hydrolase
MEAPWTTAEEAVRLVKSGDRVFIQGSAATPVRLVRALLDRHAELSDVELTAISTFGDLGFDRPEVQGPFFLNALFVSANMRSTVAGPHGEYVPVFLSEIPRLFDQGIMPLDVALVHVSPPDKHGYCSLGVSVDVACSAVRNARTVIAQVNPHMPRTLGDGQVHMSRFAAVVAVDDPLPEVDYAAHVGPGERKVAEYVSAMIEDRSTLQMGIGAIPDAILGALTGHRDLGIHTEMCSNGIIELVRRGVITNAFKKKHRGKVVTAFAFGRKAVTTWWTTTRSSPSSMRAT